MSNQDAKFNYMLLSRLKSDCEYFLGYGGKNESRLWAGNVEDQIAEMKKIWESLDVKPEWISLSDIDNYHEMMK